MDEMASEDERPSRIEGLTVWGRAKSILMGRSRGRNLIVLGVFLLVLAGAFSIVNRLLFSETSSSISYPFIIVGIIAIMWGMQRYLSEKE
jgi:hypothetical protein